MSCKIAFNGLIILFLLSCSFMAEAYLSAPSWREFAETLILLLAIYLGPFFIGLALAPKGRRRHFFLVALVIYGLGIVVVSDNEFAVLFFFCSPWLSLLYALVLRLKSSNAPHEDVACGAQEKPKSPVGEG